MICMISRRASQFELQLRDLKEARRGTCVAWDAAYCRVLRKE